MGIVSLSEAKTHLRVTQSNEDDLIQRHIDAAGEFIENYLNRPVPGLDDSPSSVPKSIMDACLLIVENLYENRGHFQETQLYENKTLHGLLYFYRVDIGI